jgi:hypothetical protein
MVICHRSPRFGIQQAIAKVQDGDAGSQHVVVIGVAGVATNRDRPSERSDDVDTRTAAERKVSIDHWEQ